MLNFEAQTLVRGLGDNNHCAAFDISKREWRLVLTFHFSQRHKQKVRV